jgi:glycosyltransferase involved in cell wall biosynthesis
VAALAEAVGRYLADPGLRERHGRAGRARVLADFRPEAIWRSTYETYRRLLSRRVPALRPIGCE